MACASGTKPFLSLRGEPCGESALSAPGGGRTEDRENKKERDRPTIALVFCLPSSVLFPDLVRIALSREQCLPNGGELADRA